MTAATPTPSAGVGATKTDLPNRFDRPEPEPSFVIDQGNAADVRNTALRWFDAGACPVPARADGSKAPDLATWAQYQNQRPSREQVEAWFGPDRHGLGLIVGAASGDMELLELEGRAVAEDAVDRLGDALQAAGLDGVWARLLTGYMEFTPSGGVHFLYRITDHPVPGNQKIAQDEHQAVLAETRGQGGFVVVAPSNGPTHPTGKAWMLDSGSEAGVVPDLTWAERIELHRVVHAVLDNAPEARPYVKPQPLTDQERPGDAWAAVTGWSDILTGWTQVYRRADMDFWRRPGKQVGISARTGGRFDGLYVWSTSTVFPAEESVTKFRAYSILEHGGDDARAASALRQQGYGAPVMSAGYEEPSPDVDSPMSRRIDLWPFLNGDYKPPEPERGAPRRDGQHLLYPGKWHSCIGPTGCGKTWFGIAHAAEEMDAGRRVVYCHFEEFAPGGTVARFRALGLSVGRIHEYLVWLDCDRSWQLGEFGYELAGIKPSLVILDGINAACSKHNRNPGEPEAVGWYRSMFVSPAVRLDAAVLSLGHPVKDKTRQDERHGFGSTAWLDEMDGVGFRITPGKTPIRRDTCGTANLYSVKDRYGSVERHGQADEKREGWYYLGSLVVDDVGEGTRIHLSAPSSGLSDGLQPEKETRDPIGTLALDVERVLRDHGGEYPSNRRLGDWLRGARVTFGDRDLAPALDELQRLGRLERGPEPEPDSRKAWPGKLTAAAANQDQDF